MARYQAARRFGAVSDPALSWRGSRYPPSSADDNLCIWLVQRTNLWAEFCGLNGKPFALPRVVAGIDFDVDSVVRGEMISSRSSAMM